MALLNITNSNVDLREEKGKTNKKGLFDSLFANILSDNEKTKKQLFPEKAINGFDINFEKKTKIKVDNNILKCVEIEKFIKTEKIGIEPGKFAESDKAKKRKLKKAGVSSGELANFLEKDSFLRVNTAIDFEYEIGEISRNLLDKKQKSNDFPDKGLSGKSGVSDFEKLYPAEAGKDLKGSEILAGKDTVFFFTSSKAIKGKDRSFMNIEQTKEKDSLLKNEKMLSEACREIDEGLNGKERLSPEKELIFPISDEDKSGVKQFGSAYLPGKKGEEIGREDKEFRRMKSGKERIDGDFLELSEEKKQIPAGSKFLTEKSIIYFNENEMDKSSPIGDNSKKSIVNVSTKVQVKEMDERSPEKAIYFKKQGNRDIVSFIEVPDKRTESSVEVNIKDTNRQIVISKQGNGKFKASIESKNLTENLVDKQVKKDKNIVLNNFEKTLKESVTAKTNVKSRLEDKRKEIEVEGLAVKNSSEKISPERTTAKVSWNVENNSQSERLDVHFNKEVVSSYRKEMENNLNGEAIRVQTVENSKSVDPKAKSIKKGIFSTNEKEERKIFSKEIYKRKALKVGSDAENRNFKLVEHKFESFITNRLTDRRFDMDRHNISQESRFTDVSFQKQNYHNVMGSGSSSSYSGDSGAGYNNHSNSFSGNGSINPPSQKFILSARFEDLRLKARMVKRFVNVTIEIPQVTFNFADLKGEIREILRNSNLSGLKVKVKSKGKEIYSETVFSDEVRSTSSLELRV